MRNLTWSNARSFAAASAALLATLGLVVGVGAAQKVTESSQIAIKHQKYTPAALTVPPDTTVTWVNRDDDPHTVTASSGQFSSPGLDTGESFSRRFTVPGTYVYFCTLHPLMTATITVK